MCLQYEVGDWQIYLFPTLTPTPLIDYYAISLNALNWRDSDRELSLLRYKQGTS